MLNMIKKFYKNNKDIIILFIASRLILILFLLIDKNKIFNIYDSIHYLNIAKYGYTKKMEYAFFPLYPLLIRALSIIFKSYAISGIIISNIFSFLSLLIIKKISKEKTNLFLFVLSPILAYNTIIYTESIYFFLTIYGYYLYKRNKYFLSSLIVGLSILTRNSGIILWGAIGIDMLYRYFIKKNIKFRDIFIFGISSLLIGSLYPIYLYYKTESFLTFATVQMTEWGRISSNFILAFVADIKQTIKMPNNIYILILNWLTFIYAAIISIKIFKKDKVSSIYILVSLIAFTITIRDINKWNTLATISQFRYVCNLFPLFILDSKNYILKNKSIFYIIIIISIYNCLLIYNNAFLG